MFVCKNCLVTLPSIYQYKCHQKNHRNERNGNFVCIYPNCLVKCSTYDSFYKHCNQFHDDVPDGSFKCPFKDCHFVSTISKIFKIHCKNHLKESKENLTCYICTHESFNFINVNAVSMHMSREHSDLYDEIFSQSGNIESASYEIAQEIENFDEVNTQEKNEVSNRVIINKVADDDENNFFNNSHLEENYKNVLEELIQESINEKISPLQIISKLYVRLSAKYFLSEPVIQDIVNSIFSVFKLSKENFLVSIQSLDIDTKIKSLVLSNFDKAVQDILETHDKKTGVYRSTYTRKKLFKSNPKYIQPVEVSILNKSGASTGYYFSYVPLLQSI